MKKIEIKTENGETILLIETPPNNFWFVADNTFNWLHFTDASGNDVAHPVKLTDDKDIPFKVEILGTYRTDKNETDVEVKENWLLPKDDNEDYYDYCFTGSKGFDGLYDQTCETKEECFLSMLKFETEKKFIYKENPLGEEMLATNHSTQSTIDRPNAWKEHDEALNNLAGPLNAKWLFVEMKVMPKKFVVLIIK